MVLKNTGNNWIAKATYQGDIFICEGQSFDEAFQGCLKMMGGES